jgi:hypothetical protein
MEMRKRVLGQKHPDTITIMANLAWTLKSQGRSAEAVNLLGEVVQLRIQKLGFDHPETVATIELLNEWEHS